VQFTSTASVGLAGTLATCQQWELGSDHKNSRERKGSSPGLGRHCRSVLAAATPLAVINMGIHTVTASLPTSQTSSHPPTDFPMRNQVRKSGSPYHGE
jgi:hypothetical protein